ncbi:Abi-alpha family protein [Nocardioides stalactiti]|uniref:Abi-alpha family protein n=1 Tax=Nocardioides stalactiti TaxID=2755356 RepID=UPI0016012B29|nr:Abi-alpha family protein [Nocardioides stalactiti]
MASLFDPLGLLPRGVAAAKAGIRVAGWTEQQAMRLLSSRLAAPGAAPRELEGPRPTASLDQKMQSLLDRALDQSTGGGQSELFHRLIDQLVPDEARIISALSDGSASPLVTIRARTATGGPGKVQLANASLVGRTANLALPAMTATYVSHLLSLGLLERGPEDTSMKQDYEILMAETYILKAIKAASRGPLPARIDKRTVRVTPLGRSLWEAATGGRL